MSRGAVTNAANARRAEDFGYVRGHGAPALQQALAAYLNRVRGTSARPEQIVVCNGYAQGIGLIIQTLRKAGAKRLAVEDPCADDDAVPVARAAGLEVVGIPVGEEGISIAPGSVVIVRDEGNRHAVISG